MSLKSPSPETIKEAVAAATRALAEDSDLEISFGGISPLPNPPTHINELPSFRGKSNATIIAILTLQILTALSIDNYGW